MITKKYIENTIEFSIKDFKKKGMTVFYLVCAIPVGIDWEEKETKIDMLHKKEIPMKKLKKFRPLLGTIKRLEEASKIDKMADDMVEEIYKLLNSIKSFPDRITGEPRTFNKLYELKGSSEV